MRKLILFFCLFILVFSVQGQKNPAFKALKKTYGKEALNVFKQAHGGLELLYYAYEHGIQIIQNNGGKSMDQYPKAPQTEIVHFTDLGVKIEGYTQYFQGQVPNQLIAVKSLYQLELEFNAKKH